MKLPLGPGALVTAAFIGPGTVTACTLAGANFGYALLWALVFATFATVILQEMSARLGVVTGKGLGEALMAGAGNPALKFAVAGLVVVALAMGNAAYQAGNLTGAALGGEAIFGLAGPNRNMWVIGLAILAAAFLLTGSYKLLERALIALVTVMSLAFAGSVLITRPDFGQLLQGLVPSVPEGGLFTAIALIGTTIVPYNLFLHASASRERWAGKGDAGLQEARMDTRVSVGLGGLISIFILVTAAASLFSSGLVIRSGADLAQAIEPAYGPAARYLVGIGLLAAGLSSAITAPMAAAYAVCELSGRPPRGSLFRVVALLVLTIGALIAGAGYNPLTVILTAQVANGILLPVVATFLLIAMNRRSLLGGHVNSPLQNLLASGVLLVTFGLGTRLILRAAGVWP
ncbi:MAG: Nramp family divalent metal transporter [Hyphomonas sp.]|uniref:Nramp family divalent metal transporter n=1 Tax=Hyphomonas sp. TaxID=87 RepID=UPI0034A04E8C